MLYKKVLLMSLSALLSAGCSVIGISSVEETSYDVVQSDGNLEVRRYAPHLVAKTVVSGDFDKAQSAGFRILADYIFGNNKAQSKIAMTAPVVQKPDNKSEDIAMTAPVLMAPGDETQEFAAKEWTMTFSMPSQYTMQTLPQPNNPKVKIEKIETRLVAALKFTGFWSRSKNEAKAKQLKTWILSTKK